MKYSEWLPTLTEKQLRALASQARVHGWRSSELPKLRKRLLSNERGKEIFEENYGEKASVQNES